MNLEKYIDRAVELYQKAYGKLDAWERERQEARKKYKTEALRLTHEAAVEENARLVKEFNEKRDAIVNELKDGVAAVEGEFLQEIKAFYAPNGAAINAEDQALLSSGIMTMDEIDEMVLKHAENPTMLRIIGRYAAENKLQLHTATLKAIYRATSAGEKEQRIFNQFKQLVNTPVSMAQQGLAGTEAFMTAAIKADEYAKDAKSRLLLAKVSVSEADMAMAKQMEHENWGAYIARNDPAGMDYLN